MKTTVTALAVVFPRVVVRGDYITTVVDASTSESKALKEIQYRVVAITETQLFVRGISDTQWIEAIRVWWEDRFVFPYIDFAEHCRQVLRIRGIFSESYKAERMKMGMFERLRFDFVHDVGTIAFMLRKVYRHR